MQCFLVIVTNVELFYMRDSKYAKRVLAIVEARPVESHSGARGNIFAETPNIFTVPLWEKIF